MVEDERARGTAGAGVDEAALAVACHAADTVAGEGLRGLLAGHPAVRLVGPGIAPAIRVLHLEAADAGELEQIGELGRDARVVVVGPVQVAAAAIRAGAAGYLTPACRAHELERVLRTTAAGRRGLSDAVTAFLVDRAGGTAAG